MRNDRRRKSSTISTINPGRITNTTNRAPNPNRGRQPRCTAYQYGKRTKQTNQTRRHPKLCHPTMDRRRTNIIPHREIRAQPKRLTQQTSRSNQIIRTERNTTRETQAHVRSPPKGIQNIYRVHLQKLQPAVSTSVGGVTGTRLGRLHSLYLTCYYTRVTTHLHFFLRVLFGESSQLATRNQIQNKES